MRFVRKLAIVTLGATTLVLSACGGEAPTESGPPGGIAPTVGRVTIAPDAVELEAGQTTQLAAAVADPYGQPVPGVTVGWRSLDDGVAGVSGSGLVTAVQGGTARIVASAAGRADTAVVTVTGGPVTEPPGTEPPGTEPPGTEEPPASGAPASLTVTRATLSIEVGQAYPLTAVVRDAIGQALGGYTVTWSTSAAAVATVSSNGLVTAVGAGSATLTATGGGRSATVAVTVTAPPPAPPGMAATVSVAPQYLTLEPGATAQATVSILDAAGSPLAGRSVAWTSSAPAVATVSSAGLVSAVAVGSATVTATVDGKTATLAVTVQPVAVATVTLTRSASSVEVGTTAQFTATPRNARGQALTGRTVTWSTSAAGVATVSAQGVVTGVAPGTATITATVDGVQASAGITVTAPPPASLTVSPATVALEVGQTLQLAATVRDANGRPLDGHAIGWATSAAGVATVSSSGLVTAVGAGSATLTVTGGGQRATVPVTVVVPPLRGTLSAAQDTSRTIWSANGATLQLMGVMVSGDDDAAGIAPYQGIATYTLPALPIGSRLERATITVTLDPLSRFGQPFDLGGLYVERTSTIALGTGPVGAGAVLVATAFTAPVTVDVTALVEAARQAGDTELALRFRFAQPGDGDEKADQLRFSASAISLTWVR